MNPQTESQTETAGSDNSGQDTLSVTDNRTGREYEIPIEDGTVRAIDFRDIKVSEDDFGLMTYDPAYLNYTMGKLMIRKLRDDWAASRGGRKAWREFHDAILTYGGPPIPMVRQQMLGSGGSLF